jgi:ligand-binding sensor domain-containing protein
MKIRTLRLALPLAVLLSWQVPSQAQWVQTDGPEGSNINCFAVSDSNLFTGTGAGVFLSTNNGTSWAEVNTGLTNHSVSALAVSGTNLFASTEGGVFLSTDNGTSWSRASTPFGGFSQMVEMGINLFAGAFDGFFLSTNNGVSWTEAGLPGGVGYNVEVNALAVSGTNLFAAFSGTEGEGVFLSTDNGTSWTATGLTTKNSWYYIESLVVNGMNLFVGTLLDGVFLSTDNGTSWKKVNNGLTNGTVKSLAIIGTNLFAGTGAGVFLSTNNGTSWTAVNNGLTNTYVNELAVSGTNLFAGTYDGVFLSTNNGTSWTAVNTDLIATEVGALAVSGTNLFACTVGGWFYGRGGGVFLSTNNGTSWSRMSTPFGGFSQMLEIGTNLFAGTWDGVFLSTDKGISWTAVNDGLPNTDVNALAISGMNLFAGTGGGGVFLSTNNGTTWTDVSTGVTTSWVSALAVSHADSGSGTSLFAGSCSIDWGGGIYLSTDNGQSWRAVKNDLNVVALAVSGTNLFAGAGWSNNGGVYLSADNGTSWTQTGLMNTDVRALTVIGTNLFAGTSDGVFLSTDNGASWTPTGLTNNTVEALAVSDTYLFAGTGNRGVWRRPLSEMLTSVEEPFVDQKPPDNFSLDQNYPNPFNPTTTIAFNLPASFFVTLKVFNSAGKEVACLVDRQMPAGNHRTEWNAYGVPNGIYFYRIQAGTYSETKKLVFIK